MVGIGELEYIMINNPAAGRHFAEPAAATV
jgi:hypothetical protein